MSELRFLDLTLPSPEANLACDEALLEACEAGTGPGVLRVWAPQQFFVVVGYANHVVQEVNIEVCRNRGIPILRRCSGGGTVLQGPGCLNYALVLPVMAHARLASLSETNRFILENHQQALAAALGRPVQIQGQTDLTLDGRKFSGNAQRRGRRAVLFHGTFLLETDERLMEAVLRFPSRAPAYRQRRSHSQFITRLPMAPENLQTVLRQTWQAREPLTHVPMSHIAALVQSRYSQPQWNLRY